jgi:hypothetical protein
MDPKTPLKTVFNVQIGIDRYAYLLRLESVVRQRLNKLLVGGEWPLSGGARVNWVHVPLPQGDPFQTISTEHCL